MEAITILTILSSVVVCTIVAYQVGKNTGESRFKDKINKLTCRQMLMHMRTQFNEVD